MRGVGKIISLDKVKKFFQYSCCRLKACPKDPAQPQGYGAGCGGQAGRFPRPLTGRRLT